MVRTQRVTMLMAVGFPAIVLVGVRVSDTVAVVDVIGLKTPAPAIVEPRIGNGVCRRQRREGQSQ